MKSEPFSVELMLWALSSLDVAELGEFQTELQALITPADLEGLLSGARAVLSAEQSAKLLDFCQSWFASVSLSRNALWQKHVAEAEEGWSADPAPRSCDEFRERVSAAR